MKKRNTAKWLVASLVLLSVCVSCKKAEDLLVQSGVDKIMSDKYMALGWDTQNTTAIGKAEKTKGGSGYVQYYYTPNGPSTTTTMRLALNPPSWINTTRWDRKPSRMENWASPLLMLNRAGRAVLTTTLREAS